MSNGDEYAYPLATESEDIEADTGITTTRYVEKYSGGLTKREYFAGLAMQALLAGKMYTHDPSTLAKWSVVYANDLLKKLGEYHEQ